jgi:phosphatidylglycerophosphate synthase
MELWRESMTSVKNCEKKTKLLGTKFGAFLDMISDRTGTLLLILLMVKHFPKESDYLILFTVIDIISHWCATLV